MVEEELTSENVIRRQLIDFALATGNESMFKLLTSEYWYLYIINYGEDDYDE